MPENSRRRFLQNSLLSLMAVPLLRHTIWAADSGVTITLAGRAEKLGPETVSFGLPLPFGFLNDARKVRVVNEHGVELPAAVRNTVGQVRSALNAKQSK